MRSTCGVVRGGTPTPEPWNTAFTDTPFTAPTRLAGIGLYTLHYNHLLTDWSGSDSLITYSRALVPLFTVIYIFLNVLVHVTSVTGENISVTKIENPGEVT